MTLREEIRLWSYNNATDLTEDDISSICVLIANAMEKEMARYRAYQPVTIVQWLRKQ